MIRINGFTEIDVSTQEDVDYVEENFREGDRLEHESLEGGRTEVGMFEECWTVRFKGEIIGYCGVMVPQGETAFSPVRWLCYMSCRNADKYKLSYVRYSREVMKRIIAESASWIGYFWSLPSAEYHGSVIWHERVLRMKRHRTVDFNGHKFVLFGISREEALK